MEWRLLLFSGHTKMALFMVLAAPFWSFPPPPLLLMRKEISFSDRFVHISRGKKSEAKICAAVPYFRTSVAEPRKPRKVFLLQEGKIQ